MIKPPWAFSIWSDADSIFAELPAINGHTLHTVKVPNDVKGLKKILFLAKARDAKSQIGSKGEPTQSQIEKISYDPSMVRRPKPKLTFTPAQINNAREVLRKLGMICLLLTLCACQMPLR
jgi:hypothetical protein